MNKEETWAYIEKVQNMGSVYGLETVRELLRRLGDPQDRLKIIHIAGTNGKGSILAMLNEIAKQAGLRCGRYLSPTIFTYLERFQINGNYMTEETLPELMSQVANVAKSMVKEGFNHPTLFELETAIAFLWFLQEKVDLVLLETGMGGRLDSTNVIQNPICVLFSSISRDHMEFLGDTLTEIAKEKAGIIKDECPVVAYPNPEEVQLVIRQEAEIHGSKLIQVKETTLHFVSGNLEGQIFSYRQYKNLKLSLLGWHQLYNAAVVLEATEQLKEFYPITEEQIRKGLSSVKWKGRFEVLQKDPIWIRDGAHNEDAAIQLRDTLKYLFPVNKQNKRKSGDFTNRRIFYIIGVLADKEYEKILEITAPLADWILTIAPDNKRALPSGKLAEAARNYMDQVVDCGTLCNAVKLAGELTTESDVVVAFGSLSFLGELKLPKKGSGERKRGNEVLMKSSNQDRFLKIIAHPDYKKIIKELKIAEQNRIFCKHTIEHFLDVARIAYIKVLEQKLELSKDIVYATAFLHDIGRLCQAVPHEQASAALAEPILQDCGYSREEISTIQEAILSHRGKKPCDEKKEQTSFNKILYDADKTSRLCLFCEAQRECNWSDDRKNKKIPY